MLPYIRSVLSVHDDNDGAKGAGTSPVLSVQSTRTKRKVEGFVIPCWYESARRRVPPRLMLGLPTACSWRWVARGSRLARRYVVCSRRYTGWCGWRFAMFATPAVYARRPHCPAAGVGGDTQSAVDTAASGCLMGVRPGFALGA